MTALRQWKICSTFTGSFRTATSSWLFCPTKQHSVAIAINRRLFWHTVRSFLDMPAPAAI